MMKRLLTLIGMMTCVFLAGCTSRVGVTSTSSKMEVYSDVVTTAEEITSEVTTEKSTVTAYVVSSIETTVAETKASTSVATTTTVSEQFTATTVRLPQATPLGYSYDNSYDTYVVTYGDTLSGIAEAYGCTIYDIKDEYLNDLSSWDIVIGQQLNVPVNCSNGASYSNYDYNEDYTDYADNNSYSYIDDNSSYSGNSWSDGSVWSNTVTLYTSGADANSWANIQLVSQILNAGGWYNYSNGNYTNGVVIGPGQSFSFFGTMGPCDGWQGFQSASAYTTKTVYDENLGYYVTVTDTISVPGGGICFPSTTIMQAARGAGCVITERHDHIGPVSYASPGDEAAVSNDGADMSFYNPSSTNSIRITMDTSSWGCCTVYVTVE